MENIVNGGQVNLPNNTEQGSLIPVPDDEPISVFDNAATTGAYFVEDELQPQPTTVQPQPSENFSSSPAAIPENGLAIQLPTVINPPHLAGNPTISQVFTDTSQARNRQYANFRDGIQENVDSRGVRFVDRVNAFPNPSPPLLTRDVGRQLFVNEQANANQRSRSRGWDTLDWEFSNYGNVPQPYNPLTPINTANTLAPYQQVQENAVQPTQPFNTFLQTGQLSGYYTPGTYDGPLQPNEILGNLQRNRVPGLASASYPGAYLPGRKPNATVDSSRSAIRGNQPAEGRTPNLIQQFLFGSPTSTVQETIDANRGLGSFVRGIVSDVFGLVQGNRSQREALQRILSGDITGESVSQLIPGTIEGAQPGLQNSAAVPSQTALTGYEFNPLQGKFGESGTGWLGGAVYGFSTAESLLYSGIYGVADLANALAGDAGEHIPIIRNIPDTGEPRGIFYRIGQALSGQDLTLLNVRDEDRYLSVVDPDLSLKENLPWVGVGLAASFVTGGWADNAVNALRRLGSRAATTAARRTVNTVPDLLRAADNTTSIAIFGTTPDELFDVPTVVQTLGDNPAADIPVPSVARRSNDEIAELARANGDIPDGVGLSNEDVRLLQQLPNGAVYSRYGANVPTTESAPLPLRDVDINSMDNIRQQIISTPNDVDTPDLIRAAIREYDNTPYTPPATAHWLTEQAPDILTPPRILNTEDVVNDPGFRLAQDYLKSSDELTNAGRGLQELEEQIEIARWEILRQSKRLRGDGDLGKLARGSAPSEVATRLNLGSSSSGDTVVKPLYAPMPVQGEAIPGLYHGTRQDNLEGVDFREGAAHEYGVGLYLTTDEQYARLASKASRVTSNPIPGTTRLSQPKVLEVFPENSGKRLNLNNTRSSQPDVMRIINQSAKRHLGLDTIDFTSPDLRTAWLDVRSTYVKNRNAAIPELQFRRFSVEVSDRLVRELGITYLEDSRRGVVVALPRGSYGQVPMLPRLKTNPPSWGFQGSYRARHAMDVELSQNLNHPVTEAWERQSRVAYENSLMNDLVKTYARESKEHDKLLNQHITKRNELAKYNDDVDRQMLREQTNPNTVPDELTEYEGVNLDEECL